MHQHVNPSTLSPSPAYIAATGTAGHGAVITTTTSDLTGVIEFMSLETGIYVIPGETTPDATIYFLDRAHIAYVSVPPRS